MAMPMGCIYFLFKCIVLIKWDLAASSAPVMKAYIDYAVLETLPDKFFQKITSPFVCNFNQITLLLVQAPNACINDIMWHNINSEGVLFWVTGS